MANDTPAIPLGTAALGSLSGRLTRPPYDRGRLQPSIVHIGVGGFHRAHLATYVHELCSQGRTDWSIVGAGVLATDAVMADALRAQDHLYCLITRGPDDTDVEIIGSIVDYLYAAE
ncbi:MAG: mannitol dehydrogenase family protein, partial [Acidimicrobiales bacterium]